MLARLFFLAQSLVFTSLCYSQRIDSIQTQEQALSFLRGVNADFKGLAFQPSKLMGGFRVEESRRRIFGGTHFEKADFDKNGQTDLLFNGFDGYDYRIALVVLSFGKDSFQIRKLTPRLTFGLVASKTLNIEGQTCIKLLIDESRTDEKSGISRLHQQIDTLVWAFDEFIERSIPCVCAIEKINFCAPPGSGFFAGMQVSVTADSGILVSEAAYQPGSPPSSMDSGGTYIAAIDPLVSSRLFGILKYINFPHLKGSYAIDATDATKGFLQINYNKGLVKKISDYGIRGTHGLAALQGILLDLRTTQQWKRLDAEAPVLLFGCKDDGTSF
jgi:hypothetical protein